MLWAAVYQPINGESLFYKLDPSDGSILKTCSLPFQGGGVGNDTLAVARPADLGGTKVLLTDAGEVLSTLFAIDITTCSVLKSYNLPVGVTGIDEDDNTGDLIVTNHWCPVKNPTIVKKPNILAVFLRKYAATI